MCGRYALTTDADTLIDTFKLAAPLELIPRYNIAPTQIVPAVRANREEPHSREIAMLRWGLIPFFSKDLSVGARLINARSETVADKPSFREAFKKRRCLIPASGFIEWKRVGKEKQPYYIRRKDEAPFAFAGLFEHWHSKEGPVVESCTILTTEPNTALKPLHNRMPVILDPENHDLWLDRGTPPNQEIAGLLVPYPDETLKAEPISRRVNNVRNDDFECLLLKA